MRCNFFAAATTLGILLASSAYGAPFSMSELQDATKVAVADFAAENPGHVEHFTGFKSWLSDDDARVKIYVNHNGMNMEFNFLCFKQAGGIECHVQ